MFGVLTPTTKQLAATPKRQTDHMTHMTTFKIN